MESYKVFTATAGAVEEGARAEKLILGRPGAAAPAIIIGEEGHDRSRAILPVNGAEIGERILFAGLEAISIGGWKLVKRPSATTAVRAIVVLRTPVAYRGANTHTGDQKADGYYGQFPGRIITKGTIVKGFHGQLGFGQQLVALVDAGAVFRSGYSGLPHDEPDEHYYMFDGERLLVATREEREAASLF